MAGQWRAEFKPGERSLRDLIADIFTLEAKYRRDAIAFLRKHASTSDKHTACIMWRLDGTCNRSTAGGRHDVSNLRTAHGVFLGKDTVCAEESFLVKHGTKGWVASVSYDLKRGWKPACRNGCQTLLQTLNITDLAEWLSEVARFNGVKNWSSV